MIAGERHTTDTEQRRFSPLRVRSGCLPPRSRFCREPAVCIDGNPEDPCAR